MAGETEDVAAAAERLEAALERIAQLAAQPHGAEKGRVVPAEVAERLEKLIVRLREALDAPS